MHKICDVRWMLTKDKKSSFGSAKCLVVNIEVKISENLTQQ